MPHARTVGFGLTIDQAKQPSLPPPDLARHAAHGQPSRCTSPSLRMLSGTNRASRVWLFRSVAQRGIRRQGEMLLTSEAEVIEATITPGAGHGYEERTRQLSSRGGEAHH